MNKFIRIKFFNLGSKFTLLNDDNKLSKNINCDKFYKYSYHFRCLISKKYLKSIHDFFFLKRRSFLVS